VLVRSLGVRSNERSSPPPSARSDAGGAAAGVRGASITRSARGASARGALGAGAATGGATGAEGAERATTVDSGDGAAAFLAALLAAFVAFGAAVARAGVATFFVTVLVVPTTSTSAVFRGLPRGFFAGSASATATDLRAVFTAVGVSPVSRYGFGSSPCAPLRGVRGPRPGDGLRRSVMSSMCYVVSTHGSVGNHRRAECAHVAPHPFLQTLQLCHIASQRRICTDTPKKENADRVTWTRTLRTNTDVLDDASGETDRGGYGSNRDGTHTLRLVRGTQAGGLSATPTSDAHVRGRAPASPGRASNSQTLEREYRHGIARAQDVRANCLWNPLAPLLPGARCGLAPGLRFSA
jgi:hypothetical protein